MKYRVYKKMVIWLFQNHVCDYMAPLCHIEDIRGFKKKTRVKYYEILEKSGDIGHPKENSLAFVYWMSGYIFAAYQVAGRTLSEEAFKALIYSIVEMPLMKKMQKKKEPFSDKELLKKQKEALRSQKKQHAMDWTFTFEGSGTYYKTTYSECGIYKLARQEDCLHLVTYICEFDFMTVGMMGGKLYRTKIIGGGDSCCDFHVVKPLSRAAKEAEVEYKDTTLR